MRRLLKEATDFTLFKRKTFLLFCIGAVLQGFFTNAYLSHLPSFVVYKGHTLEQAASLFSLLFVVNICTRLVVSFVSNLSCVNLYAQYTLGVLAGCCSILLLLTIEDYAALVASVVLCGIHLGEAPHISTAHNSKL